MRFGGPVFAHSDDPELWVRELDRLGYTAAYCPVDSNAGEDTVADFKKAACDADIVIAEVGAWSNPLSSDDRERKLAREQCSAAASTSPVPAGGNGTVPTRRT
jgi:sugar phosphate isomerase/epimerase